jgi:hypothetical protein
MSTTYTVRFWGGPRDGAEDQIECGYPPETLHGYVCAYSKLGRYYQYTWHRAAREKHTAERQSAPLKAEPPTNVQVSEVSSADEPPAF